MQGFGVFGIGGAKIGSNLKKARHGCISFDDGILHIRRALIENCVWDRMRLTYQKGSLGRQRRFFGHEVIFVHTGPPRHPESVYAPVAWLRGLLSAFRRSAAR